MVENKSYKVHINAAHPFFRSVSLWLCVVAFIGFALWYIVDLPVQDLPLMRIPYYLNLPDWLNKFFVFSVVIGAIGVFLFTLRKNTPAKLTIGIESVTIESKQRIITIKFKQLERIAFIERSLTLSPYRIEFIHKNSHFVRIKISSEHEFEEIVAALLKVIPTKLEVSYTKFESSER